MSVPQYKRSENQLEVLNIAIEVFQLIISLTKNEQVIPKKNYKYIAEPLLNTIRNLMYKISIANNLSTKKLEQLKQRYEEQIEAKNIIIMLMVDIQLAINLSNSTDSLIKFEKLLTKTEELKTKLQKWIIHTENLLKNKQEEFFP